MVSQEHPIITVYDKYDLQYDGTPRKQPAKAAAKPVCPAEVEPELFEKLADGAKRAHKALGCRDYSLYDFRVHEETNEPYLLEAGLFWSFGKISMISRMLEADGQNLEDVALELWSGAAKRTRVACGSVFKYVNRLRRSCRQEARAHMAKVIIFDEKQTQKDFFLTIAARSNM